MSIETEIHTRNGAKMLDVGFGWGSPFDSRRRLVTAPSRPLDIIIAGELLHRDDFGLVRRHCKALKRKCIVVLEPKKCGCGAETFLRTPPPPIFQQTPSIKGGLQE